MKRFSYIVVMGLLLSASLYGQSNLHVKGLGFLKDRGLDARLSFLHNVDPEAPIELDAALLEDSAFLLIEQMKRKGYLQPSIEGRFQVGGVQHIAKWEGAYAIQLAIDFVADAAEFVITPGTLSYYDSVHIVGAEAIDDAKVERFFIPGGALFSRKQTRVFTYDNLERRKSRLLRALDDLGYRSATVADQIVEADPLSGAVQLRLQIEQGPLYQLGEVEVVIEQIDGTYVSQVDVPEDTLLTRAWEQEQRSTLRSEAYRLGYPDAKIASEVVSEVESSDGRISRNLRFRVTNGQFVELAGIEFNGDEATERSVLRRQVQLDTGAPLDLIEVSEARRKLMGLGIYREVGLSLEPKQGDARTVVYGLEPNQRKELQLRGGWGSYEQARLGFRWEHRNPWGRAHRYELEAKQSLKATLGDMTYSVPQIFGSDLTAYLNAEYSFREELSFDRTAQGVAFGTSMQMQESGVRLAVEYGFSKENADRDDLGTFDSEEDATVASITFRASLDRRDDFLAPASGYSLFASYRMAGQWLGGSVDFQKLEVGGTYHFSISESTIIHAGLRASTIISSGAAEDNIPFNERIFHGGENSVRGYLEGGATPLDANGEEIGAESSVLGNFEIEQRILTQFSVVAFVDAVSNSRRGLFNEGSELLYSVGLGIRYNTAVGPLRLEYGHNPDPRPSDPSGALHFSIGFPF